LVELMWYQDKYGIQVNQEKDDILKYQFLF